MKISKEIRELLKPLTEDLVYETKHELFEVLRSFIKSFGIEDFDELTENEIMRVACELRGIKFEALNKEGLMMQLNKGETYRKIVTTPKNFLKVNDYLEYKEMKELLAFIDLKFSVTTEINGPSITFYKKNSKEILFSFNKLFKEDKFNDLCFDEIRFSIGMSREDFYQLCDEEFQAVKEVKLKKGVNNALLVPLMTLKETRALLNNIVNV